MEFVVGQQRLAIIEEHKGQVQRKVVRAAKERQKKKFDTLVSKQSSQRKPDERHVVNLSSKQLTTPQLQVLSRGSFVPSSSLRPTLWLVWRLPSHSPASLRGRPPKPELVSPTVGLSDSHIRNSHQFAQFITTQNVPDSEVLVSFDVVSLFTCVPTFQAIQVTRDHLMNGPSLPDRPSLTVDDICSLQLCLEATYLAFEGEVYRQIHGT